MSVAPVRKTRAPLQKRKNALSEKDKLQGRPRMAFWNPTFTMDKDAFEKARGKADNNASVITMLKGAIAEVGMMNSNNIKVKTPTRKMLGLPLSVKVFQKHSIISALQGQLAQYEQAANRQAAMASQPVAEAPSPSVSVRQPRAPRPNAPTQGTHVSAKDVGAVFDDMMKDIAPPPTAAQEKPIEEVLAAVRAQTGGKDLKPVSTQPPLPGTAKAAQTVVLATASGAKANGRSSKEPNPVLKIFRQKDQEMVRRKLEKIHEVPVQSPAVALARPTAQSIQHDEAITFKQGGQKADSLNVSFTPFQQEEPATRSMGGASASAATRSLGEGLNSSVPAFEQTMKDFNKAIKSVHTQPFDGSPAQVLATLENLRLNLGHAVVALMADAQESELLKDFVQTQIDTLQEPVKEAKQRLGHLQTVEDTARQADNALGDSRTHLQDARTQVDVLYEEFRTVAGELAQHAILMTRQPTRTQVEEFQKLEQNSMDRLSQLKADLAALKLEITVFQATVVEQEEALAVATAAYDKAFAVPFKATSLAPAVQTPAAAAPQQAAQASAAAAQPAPAGNGHASSQVVMALPSQQAGVPAASGNVVAFPVQGPQRKPAGTVPVQASANSFNTAPAAAAPSDLKESIAKLSAALSYLRGHKLSLRPEDDLNNNGIPDILESDAFRNLLGDAESLQAMLDELEQDFAELQGREVKKPVGKSPSKVVPLPQSAPAQGSPVFLANANPGMESR